MLSGAGPGFVKQGWASNLDDLSETTLACFTASTTSLIGEPVGKKSSERYGE